MDNTKETINVIRRWAEIFIHRAMSDFSCYGRKHNLSLSQVGVLFQLSHNGVGRVSQIADNLGITSAAVSQMLDALVKQGLVTRREDSRDRRMKQIELTDRGHRVLREIMEARGRWFASLIEQMSDREKEAVTKGLNILMEKAACIDGENERESNRENNGGKTYKIHARVKSHYKKEGCKNR